MVKDLTNAQLELVIGFINKLKIDDSIPVDTDDATIKEKFTEFKNTYKKSTVVDKAKLCIALKKDGTPCRGKKYSGCPKGLCNIHYSRGATYGIQSDADSGDTEIVEAAPLPTPEPEPEVTRKILAPRLKRPPVLGRKSPVKKSKVLTPETVIEDPEPEKKVEIPRSEEKVKTIEEREKELDEMFRKFDDEDEEIIDDVIADEAEEKEFIDDDIVDEEEEE